MRRAVTRTALVVTGAMILGGAAPDPNTSLTDWSRYAQTVADLLGDQIGRKVSIGSIEVETAMPPLLRLQDVRIGNADWGRADFLAQIGEMRVRIDLQQLLGGTIVLPEVALQHARIALERGPDGNTNWTFGPPSTGGPAVPLPLPVTPTVEKLQMDDVAIAYIDTPADRTVEGRLATVSGAATPDGGIHLTGDGTLAEQPIRFELTGDPLNDLQPGRPYALKADLRLADNQVVADGSIGQPARLQDLDMSVSAHGPGLSTLGAGFVDLPQTPPYRLRAQVKGGGDSWRLDDLDASLGETHAVGRAELALGGERPMVKAELRVPNLRYEDLVPATDAAQPLTQPAADGRFLVPDAPVPTDWLRSLDADLHLTVVQGDLPAGIDPVELQVSLKDGDLEVPLLSVGVAGGTLAGKLALDGDGPSPTASADLRYDGIELNEAFEGTRFASKTSGTVRGRVTLRAAGERIHAMMASLDGEVTALMSEGTMSGLVIEGVDLDLAEALALYVGNDTPVRIRCLIAELPIRDGVGTFRRLLIDTVDSQIRGGAKIDFGQQTVQLRLEGQGKDFSILDPDAPVFVQGPWADPSISVGKTAFIPLIELGLQEDADCAALEREVQAPPPGDQGVPPPTSTTGGAG